MIGEAVWGYLLDSLDCSYLLLIGANGRITDRDADICSLQLEIKRLPSDRDSRAVQGLGSGDASSTDIPATKRRDTVLPIEASPRRRGRLCWSKAR